MNNLVEYVQKYRAENPSGWRKWVFGTLAALAVLALIVGFGIQAALRAKELTKLKHDLDTLEQTRVKATVDASVADHKEVRDEAVGRAELAEEQAEELKEQIAVIEATHAQNAEILASIRTWEDIDAKVR